MLAYLHHFKYVGVLRERAWLLKRLIISVTFCSFRGDCNVLAWHTFDFESILSISTPHAQVDPFSNLGMSLALDILRQSYQLTPAAFTSVSTMLPNGFVRLLLLLLLLSASPYSGSPQRESIFHFSRSTSSPSLAPTLSMSSLAKSIHLLLGLPLFLLPGTAISIIVFPT